MTKKQRHIAYINATNDFIVTQFEGKPKEMFRRGLCSAISCNNDFNSHYEHYEETFPELYLFINEEAHAIGSYWWDNNAEQCRALALAFMIAMTE